MTQTEQLLTDAFWRLLEEKPYKKITVRDIVDRCQVNRNTFYYHFEGIPSLLERAVRSFEDAMLSELPAAGPPLLSLLPLIEFCSSRRAAILNLLRSKAREELLGFIDLICRHIAEEYVKEAARRAASPEFSSPPVSAEDCAVMTRFFKAGLSGYLTDWLNEGMQYDLGADIPRLSQLLENAQLDFYEHGISQRALTPMPKASGPV